MAVETTYPGIYLNEESSSGQSITTSATVVPAFAYRGGSSEHPPNGRKTVRYTNFLEFAAAHAGDEEWGYYTSVRLWFMQVGSPCYIVQKDNFEVEKYPEINLAVAAGSQTDLFTHVTRLADSNIFFLLDGPESKIAADATSSAVMQDYPSSSQAAAFYPWVKVNWNGKDFHVPASAFAAVAIAQTDRMRGPWKAPANQIINGVEPLFVVSDALQGQFNSGKALNMIRQFPDSGTTLWGARTLEDSDNWRYIPVRRLFNMMERDIRNALHNLIFEPNTSHTWQQAISAISAYLYNLWRQGALAGSRPEEAFFVKAGKGSTMTEEDIRNGKMIIQIGAAAVRPAEFIILSFTQNLNG